MASRCGMVHKCQSNIGTAVYRPICEKPSKSSAARCITSSGWQKYTCFRPTACEKWRITASRNSGADSDYFRACGGPVGKIQAPLGEQIGRPAGEPTGTF